ncbi:hypothetical protein BD847_0723 [Flavobacterium cutihirudinis]|uniref:Uncharacterized protein n=1 Tax=Flavobacterium cutihirudinis TaxID=1265740 RepID=A0A3D9G0Q3_9FLAO|nr:hypothetical protein [Flavobacterium cutihirudinis]RED26798.1 hypothetical protein BD847_0723 [Flavobacterium cutihirudinis]
MTEKFTLTGGARIGRANATYPFADLYVDKDVLKINASIVGNLVFQPKDIIELKEYKSIPLIGNGVKVIHRIENYSKEVVFWTFKDPRFVLNEIKKTGFLNNVNSNLSDADLEIMKRQNQGGFPIKKPVVVVSVIVWNLLLLSAFIPAFLNPDPKGFHFGIGVNIALALLFLTSVLILVSKSFRKLILKEGVEFQDIKKFIYFIILLSGMLFLSFGLARF